jgi:chemotaxis-related protein WspD
MSSELPAANESPLVAAEEHPLAPGEDCWSRIGVMGNGSCAELDKHIHCRNCPVYASAGARLLDRPMPENYRRDWALHFSAPKRQVAPGSVSLLLFRLGGEWLALPTQVFQEVVELRKAHTIPHRRQGALLGIVNVRGELLVAVSLARVLGIEAPKDLPKTARLLVSVWESQRVVFPVDEVYGVHRCDPEQLAEPPSTLAKSGSSYTRSVLHWQNNLVCCLDTELLFPALSQSIA